ncbi:hypothetical protein TEQG_03660 [Trichophyton equinum CBS 127.97]|uniref:Uncharacterized protein n=1 Tax=Trichophyton equinum (strain ATCC MYA-4606 / CBS 127.97) TaxID=559882 RepID=F2PRE3_TRIEC|nr:hypothetical protein TEQG_03660 [Trichophyton equinum CBS 127.97]
MALFPTNDHSSGIARKQNQTSGCCACQSPLEIPRRGNTSDEEGLPAKKIQSRMLPVAQLSRHVVPKCTYFEAPGEEEKKGPALKVGILTPRYSVQNIYYSDDITMFVSV